ncbi:MAG: hypothetical protein ACF787_10530, partial [Rhodopirellula sp. JB053]
LQGSSFLRVNSLTSAQSDGSRLGSKNHPRIRGLANHAILPESRNLTRITQTHPHHAAPPETRRLTPKKPTSVSAAEKPST